MREGVHEYSLEQQHLATWDGDDGITCTHRLLEGVRQAGTPLLMGHKSSPTTDVHMGTHVDINSTHSGRSHVQPCQHTLQVLVVKIESQSCTILLALRHWRDGAYTQ